MSILYSTCRRCRGLLHVTDGCNVHPNCAPKPTRSERLIEQLGALVPDLNAPPTDEDALNRIVDELQKLEDQPPQLGAAALAYARWGWPVFPLRAGKKSPATPHGFKDATTDAERIERWWRRYPDHNIGLPTGIAFDVIDVDLPDGPRSYAALEGLPDLHGTVRTASGGWHHYVEVAPGSGNRAGIYPGIDYRGVGGYVVAPPSQIDRSHRWGWVSAPSPLLTKETPL